MEAIGMRPIEIRKFSLGVVIHSINMDGAVVLYGGIQSKREFIDVIHELTAGFCNPVRVYSLECVLHVIANQLYSRAVGSRGTD